MKKEITLATKFTIILLVIFFIGQTLGFILFISSVRGSMIDSLNEKMNRTGSLLAGLSVNPILEKNDVLLNTYLEEIMRDEDIVSVTVFAREENLLGHKSKVLPRESSIINLFHVEPFFKSKTPVTLKSEKIGYIITTASTRKINDEISRYIVFGTIYMGVLLIIILLLISEFFTRNIRKPISDFTIAVNRLSTGDFTVMLQPEKNLEMKMLVDGFNSLSSRLKNIIQKLYLTTNGITVAIKQSGLFLDKVVKGANNQIDATKTVISAMEKTEESQGEILDNTHELAAFSQENFSSFEEVDATATELSEKTRELSQYSSEVYSTAADILAQTKQVIKSSDELTAATGVTVRNVSQIRDDLEEMKDSIKMSERLASEVREVLMGVRTKALADAVNSMKDVEEAVTKNLELVKNLEAKSQDVEKVLSVLDDVTKQTTLLSVNAAILAAQAGEYGSGFAVIADEIKTFAIKTTTSAREITKIIKSIQKEIAEALVVTENSEQIVKRSKDLVLQTDSAIAVSLEKAQNSSDMTKKIQKATEEQGKGIFQLNESMDMLMAVVAGVTGFVQNRESKELNLLDVAGRFRDISETIKISMKEQNTGTHMIIRNLEFANEMIKNIDHATSEHGKTSEEIIAVAIKAKEICNETFAIAREMAESFNTLYAEAETLKRDMEGFKIE